MLYHDQSLALTMDGDSAELRLRVPFAEKGDVKLKKIGLELVIRVGGRKRNIVLPSALASFRPRDARLEAGELRVRFERQDRHDDRAGEWTSGPGVRTNGCLRSRRWARTRRAAGGPATPREGARVEHQCLEFCPICRTADVVRAAHAAGGARALAGAPARRAAGGPRDARPLPPPPRLAAAAGGAPVEDIPIE